MKDALLGVVATAVAEDRRARGDGNTREWRRPGVRRVGRRHDQLPRDRLQS